MGMILNAKNKDSADRHLYEDGVGQILHQMLCVFTDINVFCMAYISNIRLYQLYELSAQTSDLYQAASGFSHGTHKASIRHGRNH